MRTEIRHCWPHTAAVLAVGLALGFVPPGPSTAHADAARDASRRDTCPLVRTPIVIGHRGASGYLPEHTLAAYQLAIDLGADFIEPDLVSTRDGRLVARHENDITGTTDVENRPEFASRRTTKIIDGASITGWFTEDFTLAELKTLRARERLGALRTQNATFDDRFEIPTLEEVIALAQREGARRRRAIGIYPETKHPTFFQSIGLSLEEPLVRILHGAGLRSQHDPVFIQSFEVANLQKLSRMTRLPLVQLLNDAGAPFDFVVAGDRRTYRDMATPAGLRDIARYADGIGPNKNLIIPRDASGRLLAPTTLVADAHASRLLVHPFTFRAENVFLPRDFQIGDPTNPLFPALRGDFRAELVAFDSLGLDGLFTDQPDVAVAVRAGLPPCDH
jgi:glycerophosphoryl diester phosphodiesterase